MCNNLKNRLRESKQRLERNLMETIAEFEDEWDDALQVEEVQVHRTRQTMSGVQEVWVQANVKLLEDDNVI